MNELIINPETIKQGWSQSEIMMLGNCPYKWNMRYNQRLTKTGFPEWSLLFGTAFHNFCEQYYKGVEEIEFPEIVLPEDVIVTAQIESELEYWNRILEATCEAYLVYYKADHKFYEVDPDDVELEIEHTVKVYDQKIKLRGKIDLMGLHEGKPFIMDNKSASRFSQEQAEGWDFKFQFMFYMWLAKEAKKFKASKFIVNGVRKPQLRQKKDETPAMFLNRIVDTIKKEPSNYFYRQTLLMSKHSMTHFEKTILMPKLARIALIQDQEIDDAIKSLFILDKNTDHCHVYGTRCQYHKLCQNGPEGELETFTVRENKHTELTHP